MMESQTVQEAWPGAMAPGGTRLRGIRVLLVEDNPGDARLTMEALKETGEADFRIDLSSDLRNALENLHSRGADVVLLDLSLPDSQGIDTFEKIREAAPDAALIVLSGLDDEDLATKTVQRGGQDYLVKGEFEGHLLGRTIRYAQERKRAENQMRQLNEDLKRSNAELKATQMQLIQAEKLESLGRLAAGVAHEVKNPLARILLGVEYLSGGLTPEDENVPVVLQEISDSAKRADTIIRGMVDFASASQLDMQPWDLGKLVKSSLLLVQHEITRNNIDVEEDYAPGMPPAEIDRAKMEQALVNIFLNAIHSMLGNGGRRLQIRVYPEVLADLERNQGLRTRTHLRNGDEVVVIEVNDEGGGIPADKAGKVFDPFFTTKPTGEGTGLGLTVVSKIIELHKGLITITNRAEGGACATIKLRASGGGTLDQEEERG